MRRREFIFALGGAAAVPLVLWPCGAGKYAVCARVTRELLRIWHPQRIG